MSVLHPDVTIPYFLELSASKYPDREFLICDAIRRSYGEVNERVNSLAQAWCEMGIQQGTRIGSYLANCPEILENYMAANRAGAIPVPINFRLSRREIAWILNHAEAEALVFEAQFADVVEKLRSDLKTVRVFVCVNGPAPSDMLNYEELVSSHPAIPPAIDIAPGDPAMLMYTAGTTGFPKGVLCSHENSIWGILNSCMYDLMLGRHGNSQTTAYPLPFFHMAAYINAVSQLMKFGRCVIMRSFDPVKLLESIETERVNMFIMVPAIASAILQTPDLRRWDLSSWNTVRCTGAPLPTEMKRRFAETFPHVDICDNYGMTEIVSIAMNVNRGEIVNPGTVGKPHPFTEVRIIDPEGSELPPGETGEICVRSPALFSEYYQNTEATAEAFRGQWFHTADMGAFDQEGRLYIKDRKKDMIIAGGENIYPAEIEQVLYAHSGILEASCFGIPDPKFGEAVMAAVVPRSGESLTEEEVIAYSAENLGRFKVPKRVVFLDALPKSAVGKVLRRELRKQFGGITVHYD